MGTFTRSEEISNEQFDWGVIGWRCTPAVAGAKGLVVMDVRIRPGAGHNFHRHPVQEEVIIVDSGEIEQWLGEESTLLRAGDSAFVDGGLVYAWFNTGARAARLRVVIAPSIGSGSGYELEDVSADEPWASIRSRSPR